MNLHKNQLYF